MLGPEGTPLSRRYYSQKSGRDLKDEDMIRGFEIAKDKYVFVTDEELDRLAPEKSRDIDLRKFVERDSIPPLYFERSYFLTPAGNTQKAYNLLAKTMEKIKRVGIATFVMRGKEYLVAIFSDHGILRAETMRFADELRSPADIDLPKKSKVPAATVRKFEKLISSRAKKGISPSKLEDDQTARLLNLVKKKQSKRANVVEVEAEEKNDGKVVDMMEILKRSMRGKHK